ncbi:MAG: zinc-dependent metalloprotease [candidate division WOR-3 bacterium]|nr:MAG: zinc-dependent metalloprotease [candidate division WOR-3 bacterium]
MKTNDWAKTIGTIGVLLCIVPTMLLAEQVRYTEEDYYFFEPGPVGQSRLYLDGSLVELETGSVIYPVTGSDLSHVTPEEFRAMALQAREAFDNAPNKTIVSGGRAGRGIDISYNCTSVPPAALAALESVAVYIEQLYSDEVTVSINITFAPLGPGILGVAQSYIAGNPSWTTTLNSLINDMDADDSVQTWLPTTATIPVRYNYGSSTITDENRVYFRVAPYNAVIGSYPSLAAQITFSTNFTFDYDPRDGVAGHCFQSVAAHEIGHVIGFGCGASYLTNDMELLDIYRFQRSDGTGNYNPDTWYEFQTTARMVDQSPGSDDANCDMIAVEYQMSDGDPYQTSHFSQNNVDALMQPAISAGATFYPNFFQAADRDMFDAIGWDYIFSYYLTTTIAGNGSVEIEPDTPWHDPGAPVQVTAIPDSGWIFYQWGGDLTGNNNPDTVIMDTDKTVIASFLTEFVTLTLSVIGNGTVEATPNMVQYPRGTVVELLAVPDSGWLFSHWSGNLWGTQNPDTIIMNDDKEVTANFVPDTYVEENDFAKTGGNYLIITPNPSSGVTELRYSIQDNGYPIRDMSLKIYDVTGKLVKDFSEQLSFSGYPSSAIWDGRDISGKTAPNGIYYVKFKAATYEETIKLLLVR